MKTKTKREAKQEWAKWAESKVGPKPTTLLDVWGTDVERVILEGGRHLNLKEHKYSVHGAEFLNNGEWFSMDGGIHWAKSAETFVAYIDPPAFREEKPKEEAVPELSVNLADLEKLDNHARRKELWDGQKQSWLVRLDNWIKRLS